MLATWPYIVLFLIALTAYLMTVKSQGFSRRVLFVFLMGMGLFVGLGDMLGGYDRYIYASLFDEVANIGMQGGDEKSAVVFDLYAHEPLYGWWNVLVSYFTANRYIFILVSTLLFYALIYKPFARFVDNYPFGLVVFMGIMFFFTFTYLRQMLAAAVLWNAMIYLRQRRLLPFSILVLIACGFHNSAAIFWPLYFVCGRQYKLWVVVVGLVASLGVGLSGITTSMFEVYGEVAQNAEKAVVLAAETSTARGAYIIEAVLFASLILGNYSKFSATRELKISCNIALMFCAVLLMFCTSTNGGRLTWYFMLGLISSITYLCTYTKTVTLRTVFIIVLCAALYLRIILGWGVMLWPYKTFLTPGVRDGDYIHTQYEYNPKYDEDKFCR